MTPDSDKRKAQQGELNARFEALAAEVTQVDKDLERAGAQFEFEAESFHNAMRHQSELAAERLKAMERTGVQDWSELAEGAKEALDEFENAIAKLRQAIKEKTSS